MVLLCGRQICFYKIIIKYKQRIAGTHTCVYHVQIVLFSPALHQHENIVKSKPNFFCNMKLTLILILPVGNSKIEIFIF